MNRSGRRQATGKAGEEAAVRFLIQRGFSILSRNLRYHPYEIDIVAQKDGVIHLVEVKTSRLPGWNPVQQFTPAKEAALIEAAEAFLRHHPGADIQIDLIAVELTGNHPRLRYFPDVVR